MPKSVRGVMHEYKHGELHSGSKHGPVVKSRKQAIAIALSEQRQQGKAPAPASHRRSSGETKTAPGVGNRYRSLLRGR